MEERCRACNAPVKPRLNKFSRKQEDLCPACLMSAKLAALDIDEEPDEDPENFLDLLDCGRDDSESN